MERISYLQRHGFDPTDCDNADNYFHPSDPLGPGPSFFGQQHQCHPRPLRPIPTDPFEAFRFFNRLQGMKERECVERNAYAYLNQPRPRHVIRRRKSKVQKAKVEKPDIIESFHGDELTKLYFYNPFYDLMKQKPFLKWFFGFEIIPGEAPDDSVFMPPSSLASRSVEVVENIPPTPAIVSVVAPVESSEVLSSCEDLPLQCNDFLQDTPKPEETTQEIKSEHLHRMTIHTIVRNIVSTPKYCRVEPGFSSDTQSVARISWYIPRRLSAKTFEFLSMKGFIRLGVSLVQRDLEAVSQSLLFGDLRKFVHEFVSYPPHLY